MYYTSLTHSDTLSSAPPALSARFSPQPVFSLTHFIKENNQSVYTKKWLRTTAGQSQPQQPQKETNPHNR